MSAPYSNIETKCEVAVKTHMQGIIHRIPGVNIYAGVESSNLESNIIELPCLIANAEGSEEYPPLTGQYIVDLILEVRSSAEDTTAAKHRDRVAYVRDEFANTWVSMSLSQAISDYTCAGVVLDRATQEQVERAWQTNIPMKLYCRPSD